MPPALVFYRITAGVWAGIAVSHFFGIPGLVTADCFASVFYLASAIGLLFKKPFGITLAFEVSIASTIIFAFELLNMAVHVKQLGWTSVLRAGIPALAGYAILSYFIGRLLFKTWRGEKTDG